MNPNEELKAYLDGELAPVDAERVRRAIEESPDVARAARDYAAISRAIVESPAPAPVGLEATLDSLRSGRPRIGLGTSWGLAAAGLLAVCFVAAGDRTGWRVRGVAGPVLRSAVYRTPTAAAPVRATASESARAELLAFVRGVGGEAIATREGLQIGVPASAAPEARATLRRLGGQVESVETPLGSGPGEVRFLVRFLAQGGGRIREGR